MELEIKGKNMKVSDRTHDYVEKRISKLDRYMPDIQEVFVELSVEKTRSAQDRHVAQVTVRNDGGPILRAEERSDELTVAVDAVVDKIHRQIVRYKGKRSNRWHGQSREELVPVADDFLEDLAEEEERQIVRTKRFMVSPMNEDEAIEQMELLGHDFFIFYNPDRGMMNVIYRRRDGNYGLLEPEIG